MADMTLGVRSQDFQLAREPLGRFSVADGAGHGKDEAQPAPAAAGAQRRRVAGDLAGRRGAAECLRGARAIPVCRPPRGVARRRAWSAERAIRRRVDHPGGRGTKPVPSVGPAVAGRAFECWRTNAAASVTGSCSRMMAGIHFRIFPAQGGVRRRVRRGGLDAT